jgi:hypothetical protein
MSVQTQQGPNQEQLTATMSYEVTFNDFQTALDFEAACSSLGYTPKQLFEKVIKDAVYSKRRDDAAKAIPSIVEVTSADYTVSPL